MPCCPPPLRALDPLVRPTRSLFVRSLFPSPSRTPSNRIHVAPARPLPRPHEHPRCAGGRASRTASRGAPEQGGFQGCRSPREVNEHGADATVVDGLRIQAFKRPRWSYALDLPLADVRAATAPEVSFAAWAAPRRAPKRTRALAGRAADDAGPAPKKRADADDDEGLPAGWRVVANQRERNRVTCAMSPEGLVFTSAKAARESLIKLISGMNTDVSPLNFRSEYKLNSDQKDPYYKAAPGWTTLTGGSNPTHACTPSPTQARSMR